MSDLKTLMTAAAEATLRGDPDAVAKAEIALAEIDRGRQQSGPIPSTARKSASDAAARMKGDQR